MSNDHNIQQVEELMAGWRKSGMTQDEFAKANNITIHTLRYWLNKR